MNQLMKFKRHIWYGLLGVVVATGGTTFAVFSHEEARPSSGETSRQLDFTAVYRTQILAIIHNLAGALKSYGSNEARAEAVGIATEQMLQAIVPDADRDAHLAIVSALTVYRDALRQEKEQTIAEAYKRLCDLGPLYPWSGLNALTP